MNTYLEVAIRAAKLAGESIQRAAQNIAALKIEQKSLHDYVSEVDRHSEQLIVEVLSRQFPDHQILGEESGEHGDRNSEFRWVIDPLDGTTNFLRSIPHYAVSIALLQHGEVIAAVVFDPAKDDLFIAGKGQGASLNSRPLQVSRSNSIDGALLATGVPFSGVNLANLPAFSRTMESLLKQHTSGIRRLGSAALDLAYVAAGRYDGYWEAMLKPWDIAAGVLLVQEAGGVVSDFQGEHEYLKSGDIVAANPEVHQAIIAVTSSTYH